MSFLKHGVSNIFFLYVKESTCRRLSTLVTGGWGGFARKGINQGSDCVAAQSLAWSGVGSTGLMQGRVRG